MKLRNKKTGEIVEFDKGKIILDCKDGKTIHFNSIEDLENWEDYEEPKEYWCIDWTGGVNHITVLDGIDEYEKAKKEIGNYFDTREEAEKAVEKLKAWKRLKDKGFRFGHWIIDHEKECGKVTFRADEIKLTFDEAEQFYKDITLVFGGEV